MSSHFISGKPGGGKTLYAVRLIVEELVYGSRVVITNVSLKLGDLNVYLQREFPSRSINLLERVIVLDDEATKRFWCHRPGLKIPIEVLSKERWMKNEFPDYSGVTDSGVMFVIDEVHNFFNARAWMETGRDVLFYLSQHRKLGDTCIFITQAIGNVDKQLKSVTQDYTFIRNFGKEKMGLFKLPSLFWRMTYISPPSDTSRPMETGMFRLDVSGLATCYDTAAGVSVIGRSADLGERRKGLPWPVAVIGLVAIVLFVAKFGPELVASFFKTPVARASAQVQPMTVVSNKPMVEGSVRVDEEGRVWRDPERSRRPDAISARTNKVTAAYWLNETFRVFLDSGERFRLGDGHLTQVTENYVVVDGEKLFYATPEQIPRADVQPRPVY